MELTRQRGKTRSLESPQIASLDHLSSSAYTDKNGMPALAPGIFIWKTLSKTGIIPAYKKITEEESTWHVLRW